MAENKTTIYTATTISEVLYHLKNIPNLQVLAGGTLCKKDNTDTKFELPQNCIFIGNIPELKEITKKERYIDFGSAVTLNQILEIGKNRIPLFLYEAIEKVGIYTVRNIATIGGNICAGPQKMSLYAPLLALDAFVELKSFTETKHIPLSRFTNIPQGFFLTRIRIPLQDWFTATYTKLGTNTNINNNSASYTFLADSAKGKILNDLRIAFAGTICFRSKELENLLIGTRLPLSERDSIVMLYKAEELYNETIKEDSQKNDFLKAQFLNLLEKSLRDLKRH